MPRLVSFRQSSLCSFSCFILERCKSGRFTILTAERTGDISEKFVPDAIVFALNLDVFVFPTYPHTAKTLRYVTARIIFAECSRSVFEVCPHCLPVSPVLSKFLWVFLPERFYCPHPHPGLIPVGAFVAPLPVLSFRTNVPFPCCVGIWAIAFPIIGPFPGKGAHGRDICLRAFC